MTFNTHFMAAALAVPLALGAQAANALTVDFGGEPGALPFSQHGFTFTQTVGSAAHVGDRVALRYFTLGLVPIPDLGDTVEVALDGGGSFTFDAFTIGGPSNGVPFDVLTIYGLVGGTVTQTLTGVTPAGDGSAPEAWSTGFSAPVDTVRIVLSELGSEGMWFDTMTFDEPASAVPLPGALPLLAAGIGGLALLRRSA